MSDLKKAYQQWIEQSLYKTDLLKMSEAEIEESFGSVLEFGTGGMRGIIGAGPARLNLHTIKKATLGFGRYLKTKYNNTTIKIAISFDNRHFSEDFAKASAAILSTLGIKSYIFEDLHPTPLLSYAIRSLKAQGGIMITASHNPKQYNGYKVYDETGCQLNLEETTALVNHINDINDIFSIDNGENEDLIETLDSKIDDLYIADIAKLDDKASRNLKIVYTSLHGTGYQLVKRILTTLDFDVSFVTSQCVPDPDFSQVATANPEEAGAYTQAIELAKSNTADLIIATDPDADRIGIVVLDKGSYHYLTGNQTGALLINYLLETKYNQTTSKLVMFDTIVTSDLGRKIAKAKKVRVESVLTGFKFIGEKINHLGIGEKFFFGYEESYGYLMLPIVRDKDAVQSSLMIAQMANYYKNVHHLTLVEKLNELYDKYGYHYEKQVSFSTSGLAGVQKIKDLMSYFRKNPIKSLNNIKFIVMPTH
jgi:phosphoglucomutase